MVENLSCTTCRIRKIKCDKKDPCTGCQQGRFECTFPSERRRPRNSRRQLAKRLEDIESKFLALAKGFEAGKNGDPPQEAGRSRPDVEQLTHDIGHLSVGADQSRYSSNRLWTSLSQEVK